MRLKSKTIWFSIKKWFPPNDLIAREISRLCILREDLFIEFLGIVSECPMDAVMPRSWEQSASFDGNGEHWRRLYFVRNSLKTLSEIRDSINILNNNDDFRQLLAAKGSDFSSQFRAYLKRLNKGLKDLQRIRNALGGHISKEAVNCALDVLDYGETGSFEFGKRELDTHYGFVKTICVRMFYEGIKLPDAKEYSYKVYGLLEDTFTIIGNLLAIYLTDRRLI